MGRLPVLLAWLVVAASWRVAPAAAAAVTANSNGDRDPEGHSQPLVRDQPPALEESALDGLAIDAAAAAAEEEYIPIGLQIWPDEGSLLRALDGGRLILVIIHAPWCNRDGGMGRTAAVAADLVDATFQQLSSDASLPPGMSKPVIGTMEDAIYDGLSESLGPVTHYPALKFVLTSTNRTAVGTEEEGEAQVEIWDFLGPRETAKDLHDAVLMYWYRFVVADAMGNGSREPTPPVFTFSSQQQMSNFLQRHGDWFLGPSRIRRRVKSKVESEMSRLYMGQDDVGGVFHTHDLGLDDVRTPCNPPRKKWRNKGDEGLRDCGERGEYIQEIDPFTLLVQCRKVDWGTVDLDGSKKMSDAQTIHLDNQRRAQGDFVELADEYFHRKDVAFFSLNTTMHDDETEFGDSSYCGGLFDGVEGAGNGAVAFLRARRYAVYSVSDQADEPINDKQKHSAWSHRRRRVIHKVTTDWSESPHAVFVPSTTADTAHPPKKIHGKGATNDSPAKYVQSNLVASAVVHTTPTVLYFDRDRMAQLAFSWYRKTHAVLFVDIAVAHKAWSPNHHANNAGRPDWPSSITHSIEAEQLLLDHQRAIQLFYNAALQHRVKRPSEDVVFLIVPSTEVRILTTFGIDIWTPLDEALVQSIKEAKSSGEDEEIGQCSAPDQGRNHTLPVMMITDSSGRSGTQSSRYYLPTEDIFSSSSRSSFDEGGAIGDFVDGFFSGTLGRPFVRSEGSQSPDEPNVTVLTGNTFDALVMDRADEHTMLLIQASTCGHCKRFSIFWNDLASLVQSMNWGSVIKVMKIDVAKNDVPLDARDLPSVYYFPAGEKGNPIEMTPRMDRTIPQNDYDEGLGWVKSGLDILEWMIAQGKLDLDDLSGKAGLDFAEDDTPDNEEDEIAAGSESPPEDS